MVPPSHPLSPALQVRWIAKEADLSQAKALMNLWGISALMVDTGGAEPGERAL